MTEEQYIQWDAFRKTKGNTIKRWEATMIAEYYSEVFNKKYNKPCTCNGKIYQNMINKLNAHFEGIERPE